MQSKIVSLLALLAVTITGFSQFDSNPYWQQKIEYEIQVDLDIYSHKLTGFESMMYINNSPDTLKRVYFHLYYNAFQPGSMMDVRSRTIEDPDGRVKDYISKLSPSEQGYQHIKNMTHEGQPVDFKIEGTVMTVFLKNPILPHSVTSLELQFEAQIPKQIRRTGRDNKEGIDYTMTQWYPKMAEYDVDGWHAEEYVGREFYGVFGNFDVTIAIDSNYTVAGTGVCLNPDQVGHGYSQFKATGGDEMIFWHFFAANVHDFAWAADSNYQHDIIQADDSLKIHFFYQGDTLSKQWRDIQKDVVKIFNTTNTTFGRYPYSDFSVIQGGDGGMEYPMCTMILGHGSKQGKVGLIAHESIHNWYYGVLGTNEYRYPWMDEGMTTYAEAFAMDKLYNRNGKDFMAHEYENYRSLVGYGVGLEEPMATPGDLFNYNFAYSVSSYSKGAITLNMLRYLMGDEPFYRAMKRYFNEWKFKHPKPENFIRIMELESGLELDWFFEHWLYTVHHIEYSVSAEISDNSETTVMLSNNGQFPMPIEVEVTLKSGAVENYYIPLRQMRSVKTTEAETLDSWAWVNPSYEFTVAHSLSDIKTIVIDPKGMMADIDPSNNTFPSKEAKTENTGKKKKKRK